MVKMCRYDPDRRCFHLSCSLFDRLSGNVSVCPLFDGGDLFSPRKVCVDRGSIFSKRSKVGRRKGVGVF